ncbi:MAG: primosomal protein N' (replication factor Y) - superfamily II helicase, partial [Gemmatimonadota bacterium]|nr:primosomal protein N' (replication factor Y) - superfamily II helicase [Gemmatimonadota bacterium]
VAARVFPCKSCGASLKFAPGVGRLTCSNCGTQNELPTFDQDTIAKAHEELDYRAALRQQEGNEVSIDALLVQCPQCGAQTRFDPNVVASVCAFCATPLVSVTAHTGHQIQPRALVPFTLEPASAQTLFRNWIQGRWFAPNALRKTVSNVQAVRGVYVPCWTFDADTSSDYDGQRGINRTVYETTRDAQGREITVSRTVTDWYAVSGNVRVNFDDELILASNSIPAHLAGVLQGWDVTRLVPFSDDFVAGFTVEAYQLALQPAFEQAQIRFNSAIEGAARENIGGDSQRVQSVQTQYGAIAFKHILLPVWICSYLFAGKSWRVVVNGQTGAVKGDRPYSKWKIGLAVLAVLAVLLTIYAINRQ